MADVIKVVLPIVIVHAVVLGIILFVIKKLLLLDTMKAVNTVKQVEVFGKISAHFNWDVPEDLKLRDLNTIALLSDYIQGKAGSGEAIADAASPEQPIAADQAGDDVMGTIQAIIAEHTGYTVDKMLASPEKVQAFVHPDDRMLVIGVRHGWCDFKVFR